MNKPFTLIVGTLSLIAVCHTALADNCNQSNQGVRQACLSLQNSYQQVQQQNSHELQQSMSAIQHNIDKSKTQFKEEALKHNPTAKAPVKTDWFGNFGNAAKPADAATTPPTQNNTKPSRQGGAWNFLGNQTKPSQAKGSNKPTNTTKQTSNIVY